MDLKLISKRLNIPFEIVRHITTENWEQVYGYFKYRWNEDGYAAWKRNQKAVNRIVSVFIKLKKSDYTATKTELKAIGLYVERLGVKALVDDMTEAMGKNPRIRTIMYFLKTQQGEKLSRWGNLYLSKVETEIKVEKTHQDNVEKAVGKELFGDNVPFRRFDDHSQGAERKPEWLEDDEKRLEELNQIPKNRLTLQEKGEKAFLVMRLSNIKNGKWRVN